MEQEVKLNQHNKAEYPPMHTAEHILNGTMVKMFGCGRAVSAHVERTKSKLDYDFLANSRQKKLPPLRPASTR